ncbi:hypothetical protein JX265_000420 [Neoarthrinium moseri]|uniref:Uncharacterized protein n=1 Tax=Neoarthrinium moseri TaxID=1658444 RepID=A0A9P9WYQ9_9PEZI|nr:hypothetical protein JX265_000420 [Neoarthrinium moseri]
MTRAKPPRHLACIAQVDEEHTALEHGQSGASNFESSAAWPSLNHLSPSKWSNADRNRIRQKPNAYLQHPMAGLVKRESTAAEYQAMDLFLTLFLTRCEHKNPNFRRTAATPHQYTTPDQLFLSRIGAYSQILWYQDGGTV